MMIAELKFKLSTGKEINLNENEAKELFNDFKKIYDIKYYPIIEYPVIDLPSTIRPWTITC